MSKAILVIDMPESCVGCRIRVDDEYSNWCAYANPEPNGVWRYVEKATKPDWCPLKPMPERDEAYHLHEYDAGYKVGWNDCIKTISGENQ